MSRILILQSLTAVSCHGVAPVTVLNCVVLIPVLSEEPLDVQNFYHVISPGNVCFRWLVATGFLLLLHTPKGRSLAKLHFINYTLISK